MIVCSLPRCGATKFCLDLQESTGIEFIGELNPMYIDSFGDTAKALNHETSFQPLYSSKKFYDILTNPQKYIILVNQSPHLAVHSSDYIILRKNMKDAFISQANFFIKSRPFLKGEAIIQHLYLSFHSLIGMKAYLENSSKDVIWYEDYFNLEGTNSEYLDNHVHSKVIYKHIDSMFNKVFK